MMDFISVPLVVGIVCAGIYGLFELFVRKRERLAIIEKIGDKLDASAFDGKLGLPNYMRNFSFSSLKAGCLLAGIGLGLLVGFIINMCMATNSYYDDGWYRHEVAGTAASGLRPMSSVRGPITGMVSAARPELEGTSKESRPRTIYINVV